VAKISVIICSQNPREQYLNHVLLALMSQTLPQKEWEIILIDNASKKPLKNRFDLSWHSNARIIREEKPGLTQARICGIQKAKGYVLLFVDDDNILNTTYLKQVLNISRYHKNWGVWSGSAIAKYTQIPKPFWKKYERYICVRKINTEMESRSLFDWEAMPHGAGMAVRRGVAKQYARLCKKNRVRRSMDRTGSQLISGGDNDIALCAYQAGLKYGVTPKLSLLHLIPKERVRPFYFLKIIRGSAYSNHLLAEIHSGKKSRVLIFRQLFGLVKRINLFEPRETLVEAFRVWGNLQYAFQNR